MTIGPGTSNSKLARILAEISSDDDIFFQLTQEQQEALNEAEERIREMGDEGDDT